MKDRLYLTDSYLKEFDAKIMGREVIDGAPAVVLDRTAFYPTSGGQMHDSGAIANVPVKNVLVRDGKIWHLVEGEPDSAETVHCRIDWERRFDFMQQHTAFHILAQSFQRITGAETLSSHLGEKYSTIDVELDNHDAHALAKVEHLANEVIWQDRPVTSFFCSREEMEKYPNVRKSEAEYEPIRLVSVEDFDLDPCGGTHVSSTGQVGLAKILRYEKVRGYLRYTFVAGGRALREFSGYADILGSLADSLTTGVADLPKAVDALLETNKTLLKEQKQLKSRLLDFNLEEIKSRLHQNPVGVFELPGMDMAELRKAASIVIKECQATVVLFSNEDKLNLVMATSVSGLDLREKLARVTEVINGKGGGSPEFVQAGAPRYDDTKKLKYLIEELLGNKSLA